MLNAEPHIQMPLQLRIVNAMLLALSVLVLLLIPPLLPLLPPAGKANVLLQPHSSPPKTKPLVKQQSWNQIWEHVAMPYVNQQSKLSLVLKEQPYVSLHSLALQQTRSITVPKPFKELEELMVTEVAKTRQHQVKHAKHGILKHQRVTTQLQTKNQTMDLNKTFAETLPTTISGAGLMMQVVIGESVPHLSNQHAKALKIATKLSSLKVAVPK
jgi:hypothetical protein